MLEPFVLSDWRMDVAGRHPRGQATVTDLATLCILQNQATLAIHIHCKLPNSLKRDFNSILASTTRYFINCLANSLTRNSCL